MLRRLGLLVWEGGGRQVCRLPDRAAYQGFQGVTFVEFPRGTGTRAMAEQLARAGVVHSNWEFLLARWASGVKVLQAGNTDSRGRRARWK